MCPIVATPRDDTELGAAAVDPQAIAIPFHLEGPSLSSRRLLRQQCPTGLNAIRHRIGKEINLQNAVQGGGDWRAPQRLAARDGSQETLRNRSSCHTERHPTRRTLTIQRWLKKRVPARATS